MTAIAALCNWLLNWARYLGIIILNFFVDVIQAAIDGLVDFIKVIVELCTGQPLRPLTDPIVNALTTEQAQHVYSTTLITLNWLFPIQFTITVMMYINAILICYVTFAPLARWFKLLR